ncbi:MAG: glycosyltransferase family 2 protein [Anaerolineae bacterium]|nr:glycosyltransferase family 2 protein [Anaerolineae bacterium]
MKLSIITTLYYSAPYLPEFYRRVFNTAQTLTADIELVLVNDGSPDDSLALARRLYEQDARVLVVDLARNFGHHRAIMTGLAYCTGDLVFLIDCDLEEAPETLTQFYAALHADPAADVVYSVQSRRQGPALRRIPGDLYYRLVNYLSEFKVPRNILMTRLMTRRYVQALLLHREQLFSIEGLWEMTGYKQIPITIDKTFKGTSTYSLGKKLWLALYAITAMSSKPLIGIAWLGLLMIVPSGAVIVLLLLQRLTGYTDVEGWTSLLASLWFLSGLIIFILGIIAIYISVIFTETKPRPYTIVREVYRHHAEAGPAAPPRSAALTESR